MKNLIFSPITDPGLQRTNNEDSFIAQKLWNDHTLLLAAIDGVGGYNAGEEAADIAKKTIIDSLERGNGEPHQLLREAICLANNQIITKAKEKPELTGMGCVLSVAIVDINKQELYIGHVGDTRIYVCRGGVLRKLTHDHSLVGHREEQNELTEAEAMTHPQRNEIMRGLGFDMHKPHDENFIDTATDTFLPNDLLLLCSDGLTDMLTKAQIEHIINQNSSLETKNEALVKAANQAGGRDNITAVLALYKTEIKTKEVLQAPKKEAITQKEVIIEKETKDATVENVNQNKPNLWYLWLLIGLLAGSLLGATSFYYYNEQKPKTVSPTVDTAHVQKPQIVHDTVWVKTDSLKEAPKNTMNR